MVPLLRMDLDDYVKRWNSHSIRPSSYAICPGGVPEDLYTMPQHYGKYIQAGG